MLGHDASMSCRRTTALALSAASSRAQTIKKNETGLPVYPNIKTGIQYKINGGYGPALLPINGKRYDTYVTSSCTSMFRVPESFTPPSPSSALEDLCARHAPETAHCQGHASFDWHAGWASDMRRRS